jgi:hypothetical protein
MQRGHAPCLSPFTRSFYDLGSTDDFARLVIASISLRFGQLVGILDIQER